MKCSLAIIEERKWARKCQVVTMRGHHLRFGHHKDLALALLLLVLCLRDAECLNGRQRRAKAAKSNWVKVETGPVELSVFERELVTEKMTADTEKNNSFGFVVADGANKVEIKKAIEKEYGVNVTSVRTLRVDGKSRQRFTKTGVVKGRTVGYKKAIVSLAEGEMIDFYENI